MSEVLPRLNRHLKTGCYHKGPVSGYRLLMDQWLITEVFRNYSGTQVQQHTMYKLKYTWKAIERPSVAERGTIYIRKKTPTVLTLIPSNLEPRSSSAPIAVSVQVLDCWSSNACCTAQQYNLPFLLGSATHALWCL